VPRRLLFGTAREGVTGVWRKLHNNERHKLYSPSKIIRVMESRRMRLVGHIAHM
jgi:hypothetical protein